MPDNKEPKESFDVYADQFTITITPFGANLTFGVVEAHPTPTKPPQSEIHGTVRMSVEHLKLMVMIIRRQVLKVEHDMGVKAELPVKVLQGLSISTEDWDSLWKYQDPF